MRRTIVILASGGAALAVVGAGAACLPDLIQSDAGDASPNGPFCGDGIIDLDAGEHCDLGMTGGVGCTTSCQLDCPNGVTRTVNDHCYFLLPPAQDFAYAVQTSDGNGADVRCSGQQYHGHVATYADLDEYTTVVALLSRKPEKPDYFWVPLMSIRPQDNYPSLNGIAEPGWVHSCTGCYVFSPTPDADLPRGPVDAASNCVLAQKDMPSWVQSPCNISTQAGVVPRIVCEREPPGTRARYGVNGGIGFDVPPTYPKKHYIYVPTTVRYNETNCASYAGDAGTGRLVVFQSREEREEVWRVLLGLGAGKVPTDIWIGLSLDGGTWTWDDGRVDGDGGYPSEWGDNEPKNTGVPRAYASTPPGAVDFQLAHADAPDRRLPYVCEIAQ